MKQQNENEESNAVSVSVPDLTRFTDSRRVRPKHQRHLPKAALPAVALCTISPLL